MFTITGVLKDLNFKFSSGGTPMLEVRVGDLEDTVAPVPIMFLGNLAQLYMDNFEDVFENSPVTVQAQLEVREYQGKSYISLVGHTMIPEIQPITNLATQGRLVGRVESLDSIQTKNGKSLPTANVTFLVPYRGETPPTASVRLRNDTLQVGGLYTFNLAISTWSPRDKPEKVYLSLLETAHTLVGATNPAEEIPF